MPAPTYSFSCTIKDTSAAASSASTSSASSAASVSAAPDAAVADDATMSIDFFAFDTNGVQVSPRFLLCSLHCFGLDKKDFYFLLQGDVQRRFPDAQRWLCAYRDELKEQLAKSRARVKIVYAHHPLYTAGRNHGQVRAIQCATFAMECCISHAAASRVSQ